MLIFISDLHMPDGTTGKEQILPSQAFSGTFRDLGTHATSAVKNLPEEEQEVTIVYLGDVFDVIRSQAWFQWDPDLRPWGRNPSDELVRKVFEMVVETNARAFEMLRSDFKIPKEEDGFGFPQNAVIKKIYVPGNHDRLCDQDPILRKRVVEVLGITHWDANTPIDQVDLNVTPFCHYFVDRNHRTFARHGHEWDSFNFGGSAALERTGPDGKLIWDEVPAKDYWQTPIGDVIACEVASRLPEVVKQKLEERGCKEDVVNQVFQHMQAIFDVRPLSAMIPWLVYQVKRQTEDDAKAAINDAVQQVAHDFLQIPFVEEWLRAHDKWYHPLDDADKIEIVCTALATFKLTSLQPGAELADRFSHLLQGSNFGEDALREFERLDSKWPHEIQYVLYGHTHQPDQQAIDLCPPDSPLFDRVYINTGCWRPSFHQTRSKAGFIYWKGLTYSLIYKCDENVEKGVKTPYPTFETWTGSLKDERVVGPVVSEPCA